MLLYLHKYLICSNKPLTLVAVDFSQFFYRMPKVKFSQEWIHGSEHFFLAWLCDKNLPPEELLPKLFLISMNYT